MAIFVDFVVRAAEIYSFAMTASHDSCITDKAPDEHCPPTHPNASLFLTTAAL